jgi:hypothetical protein
LTTVAGVDLSVDSSSTVGLGAVRDFISGRLQAAGADLTLDNLEIIDGSSLLATGGGTLALPGMTSYNLAPTGSFQTQTIRAEGAGSRIDLPGVGSLANGTHYTVRLQVEALAGGEVRMADLRRIIDPGAGDTRRRSNDLLAQGKGGVLDLGTLEAFTDAYGIASGDPDGHWSTLAATDGGIIRAPSLTTLRGVELTLDG